MISSPAYWRASKTWREFVGLEGKVIASTYIRVSTSDSPAPYSYVVVELKKGDRIEAQGAGREVLQVGDSVRCVVRAMRLSDPTGVIEYGIKVEKV